MSNQCVIYYGTVVNEDGDGWAEKGSHDKEPIRVEGHEPLGKEPEICCDDFRKAMADFIFIFISDHRGNKLGLRTASGLNLEMTIRFCPFCGAKVILQENLKLKVVATPHVVQSYHFEKAYDN